MLKYLLNKITCYLLYLHTVLVYCMFCTKVIQYDSYRMTSRQQRHLHSVPGIHGHQICGGCAPCRSAIFIFPLVHISIGPLIRLGPRFQFFVGPCQGLHDRSNSRAGSILPIHTVSIHPQIPQFTHMTNWLQFNR